MIFPGAEEHSGQSNTESKAADRRFMALALALGRVRGLDPDRPRNLARSVILTPR